MINPDKIVKGLKVRIKSDDPFKEYKGLFVNQVGTIDSFISSKELVWVRLLPGPYAYIFHISEIEEVEDNV